MRPIFEELLRTEQESGIYRCQIAAQILSEGLIGKVVDRELRKAVPTAKPAKDTVGLKGEVEPRKMPKPLADFHW